MSDLKKNAPKVSLRPMLPKEVKEAEHRKNTQIGDVEFEADLRASGSFGPVAELGMKSGSKPHFTLVPLNAPAFTVSADKFKNQVNDGGFTRDPVGVNDVVVSQPHYAKPEVWSHEFRHVGIDYMKKKLDKEGVKYFEKFGIPGLDLANALTEGSRMEEALIELFDVSKASKVLDPDKGSTVADTMQELRRIPEEMRPILQNVLTEVAIDMLENKEGDMDKAKAWLREAHSD